VKKTRRGAGTVRISGAAAMNETAGSNTETQYSIDARTAQQHADVMNQLRSYLAGGISRQELQEMVDRIDGKNAREVADMTRNPSGQNNTPAARIVQDAHDAGVSVDEYLRQNWERFERNGRLNEDARQALELEKSGRQYSISRISREDVAAIQSIGVRKSVNSFTSADIRKTEALARQEWMMLGEKSPFFRAWFGDWRVNDQTPVKVADVQGDARGLQHNDDTGWNVNVSGKVFNESRHAAKRNQAALPYLPYINDIVKKAVLLDSFTMDESKSENSVMMHSLYAVADIGNGPELLKLYVEEMADPSSGDTAKRAYQLQNIERQQSGVKGSAQAPSLITQTADIETVADLFAAVKGRDVNFKPNPASKAVNEDGTPKVMYRGDSENFNVFDRKKSRYTNLNGRGFYFTDSGSHAGQYGNVRRFFLDIKNPVPMDKRTITRDQMQRFLEAVRENDEDYSFENYGYGATVNDVLDSVYGKSDFAMLSDVSQTAIGDTVAAVELFNRVNGTDFDGFILPTETVVFSPEQVKSATGNVGTFDRGTGDIRYSVADEPTGLSLPAQEESRSFDEQQEELTLPEVTSAMPRQTRRFYEDAQKKIVDDLAETLSVPKTAKREFLESIGKRLNEEYMRNGAVSQDTVDELFDTAWANGLIVDGDYYESNKEIKKLLRDVAVTISEQDSRRMVSPSRPCISSHFAPAARRAPGDASRQLRFKNSRLVNSAPLRRMYSP